MWICFNNAFLSIVEDTYNSDMVFVRARRGEHLNAFLQRVSDKPQIKKTPNSDYQYRIHIDKKTAAFIVCEHMMNIDYSNFKNSVEDDNLHRMYNKFWSVGMMALDERSIHDDWEDVV
jgi:hypothetical protein